jgi:protoporphyrinogen oxidase
MLDVTGENHGDLAGTARDVLVLGAGISGLVSASILLRQGAKNIVIVDEYAHVGGNHIDCRIGEYTFDIGSFIFQDDSPLLEHFPEIRPIYVPIVPTWGRLNPQGVVTHYPISIKDDVIVAGPVEWVRMIFSVLFARLFCRRLTNAKDFAQFWMGGRLFYRSGLRNYMSRFYGIAAEKIDIEFAEKRMFWIREHARLRNLVRHLLKSRKKTKANTQLARPREGFAHLYQPSVRRLEKSGVTFLLGEEMQSLKKDGDVFVLQTASRRVALSRVVSTIPLDRIQKLCGIVADERLKTVTLISLFFSFSGDRGFQQSILYNFSHAGAWKRLTVFSDFYGKCEGRDYFTVEANADHVTNSVDAIERDFRRHVSENGLFVGDLKLEGSHITSNAYPVYTAKADERAANIVAKLRTFGIESIGRQGAFDYQPTARVTTLEAEIALSRRFNA